MGLKFKCEMCGVYHHAYAIHFTMGKICVRCAAVVRHGEPLEKAFIVRKALGRLEMVERSAYRAIEEGCSDSVRRIALKMKVKALIQHDRILRGDPEREKAQELVQ